MKSIIKVFDNGGKSFDRYTVVILENPVDLQFGLVFCMSDNPLNAQGFNQYCGAVASLPLVIDALAGEKTELGKEVPFFSLPKDVKIAIKKRIKE